MKKTTLICLFLIGCLSTKLIAGEPYKGSQAVVLSEYLFKKEQVSFKSCHASTIEETSAGLITAWFGGTEEKNPDVAIWASRFINGKWSIPVEVANGVQKDGSRFPTWNPVLYNAGKELILFYKVGPNCSDWWGEMKTSINNGETWSKSTRLPKGIWGPIKNKPVLLSNNVLLCPSSTEYDGERIHLESTSDGGRNWQKTDPLNDGKEFSSIQPSILSYGNGKLQLLCRSKSRVILTTWSTDNGKTWSHLERTQLPNPDSGIDAVTLKSGVQLLTYNHFNPKWDWESRNILTVAISQDGVKWDGAAALEYDLDPDTEYSYPAVIQTKDGLVHITYTWNRKLIKHVVLDPNRFKTKPILNGIWPEEK